jgi:hypothetical protein
MRLFARGDQGVVDARAADAAVAKLRPRGGANHTISTARQLRHIAMRGEEYNDSCPK